MSNILLYSKFSPCCEKLFDLLNSVPEFLQYFRIIPICIDNKNIRDKIMQEREIMVNYVPTLLLMVGNGTIEKYEGEYVFEWIREKINPKKEPQIHENKQGENIIPENNGNRKKEPPIKNKPQSRKPPPKTVKGTSISDIPDEPDEPESEDLQGEDNIDDNIDDIIEEIEDEEQVPVKSPNGKINVQAAMAQAEAHRLKLEEQIQGSRKRPNVVRR